MEPANKHNQRLLEALPLIAPELPPIIRYHDDFLGQFFSLRNLTDDDVWKISNRGSTALLDFSDFPGGLRQLFKHWCCCQIQTHSVGTARIRFHWLCHISLSDLTLVISSSPYTIRSQWKALLTHNYTSGAMDALRSLLYHFCQFGMLGWSPEYEHFISTLASPACEKFGSVRTGEAFLSANEEAALVGYLDHTCERIQRSATLIGSEELRGATILACSFQFGLRPMQIGMLRLCDVRVWTKASEAIPSVHLTFRMIKQRSTNKALPLPRKVKREWAPLFVELHARALRADMAATDHFFGVSSASQTGSVILRTTANILPRARSATVLRHTAAQRLVDAGANQEELAEFLGHSDVESGLVYFQTSANQAERVNKALGISSIYQQIKKIAHDRFIDKQELAKLKGEQQIGAVPHGIPITGIGACSIGQPSCPSNPVTACYGCVKFMPVADPDVHKQVLIDLRSVVTFFAEASSGEESSPAYLQLKRTISNVQSIIAEIEGHADE